MPLRHFMMALLSVGLLLYSSIGEETNRERRAAEEKKNNLVFKSEQHPDQKKSYPPKELKARPVLDLSHNKKGDEPLQKKPVKIQTSTEMSSPPEYRLKPGDRIEVSVWGEDMTLSLIHI